MVTWLQPFLCPRTTKLFSGEGQEIRLMACPGVMCARKCNERGFLINMTGVLWLSGLLSDHQRDHFILMLKLHASVADRVITGYVWQLLNKHHKSQA